jgi:hypothetical protein
MECHPKVQKILDKYPAPVAHFEQNLGRDITLHWICHEDPDRVVALLLKLLTPRVPHPETDS